MIPMTLAWVILVMNSANATHGWLYPAGPFPSKALCSLYIEGDTPASTDDSYILQCVQVALPALDDER